MPQRHASRAGRTAVPYRIVIRGTIGEPLVGPVEGMRLECLGDEAELAGDIVDQAQLRGVLDWLSDLGVEIVSVNPVREPAKNP
jgi:hypothetical protein